MQSHHTNRYRAGLIAALTLLFSSPAMAADGKTEGGNAAVDPFVGLQPGLGSLPLLGRGRTRSISAENPTGEKGKGRHGNPQSDRAQAGGERPGCGRPRPGLESPAFHPSQRRETAVLMDVAGPGIIQHIWMVEGSKPRPCHPVLLGWRRDSIGGVARPGLLRRGPRPVRAGEFPGGRGQPRQRPELFLADAVSDARPDHSDQ